MSQISVIMPVYNVEKYLERTVESVLNQSFQDLELILVEDGATDTSAQLCDAFAQKDSRVKVLHKKNEGASIARNKAMELVQSKYIYFMDADDYIEKSMLEEMYNMMETNQLDLVVCGFYFETEGKNKEGEIQVEHCPIDYETCIFNNKEEFKKKFVDLWDKSLLYNIWNKLFRTDLLKEHRIRYMESRLGEDVRFIMDYLLYCNKVGIQKEKYYHYIREREGSLTTSYVPNLFEFREEEYRYMKNFFQEYGIQTPEAMEYVARRYIERVLGCVENIFHDLECKGMRARVAYMKRIIRHPSTQEALKSIVPTSKKVRIMIIPLKWKNALMTYWMGSIISKLRNSNPMLFNKLKQKR